MEDYQKLLSAICYLLPEVYQGIAYSFLLKENKTELVSKLKKLKDILSKSEILK